MPAVLTHLRTGSAVSAAGHVALAFVAQFGLPFLFSPPPVTATVIPVEVVRIDDVTRPPAPAAPEPEPEPVRAAPPPPPQPVPEPPAPVAPPKPPPPPVPEPPAPVAPPKPPKPAAAEPPPPLARPAPPREKAPEPAPAPEIVRAEPKAKPRPPAPVRSFDNVLKDLGAERKPTEAPRRAREPEAAQKKGREAPPQTRVAERASIAELDLLRQMIRQQIGRCWNPPVGARDAEDLIVTIFIRVDLQGIVREATVVDAPLMGLSKYFQAAAEAARRAVLNQNCQPLQLPADKYEIWKEIRFNFDPSKMLS